jgi:hypothetical protein
MDKKITLNGVAGGNLRPMSFAKLDTSNDLTFLQAGAGDTPTGITDTYSQFAGGTPADTGLLASAGDFVGVATVGSVVPLQCGAAGTWGPGVMLKPDASGFGTPTSGIGDIAGAVSLYGATPGTQSRVRVIDPTVAGVGQVAVTVVASGNITLTSANSGQTIYLTAASADQVVTLPTFTTAVVGQIFTIVSNSVGGTVGTTITAPSGTSVFGTIDDGPVVITGASGKGLINTHATAAAGDSVVLKCVSNNGTSACAFEIVDSTGIWARVA